MKNSKQKNIPDGWEIKKLGDVVKFWNGKGHEKDISEDGRYVVVNSKFISSDGTVRKFSNKQKSPLEKGDVVMVMSDVPNGKAIAKTYLIEKDRKYTLNQRIGGFKATKIISEFLVKLINRNKYFLSFDDGVNQTNLRKDDILACKLIFPSTKEQKRIVGVLEAWDGGIEVLERKIVVKENIKKGLMQQLLTGKKRLPGFSGIWEEKKLVEIGEARTSSVDKKSIDGERQISLLNYMDVYKRNHIFQNDIFQQVSAKDAQIISSNLKQGDILFTPSSETPDDIGHSAVVMENLENILFSYHLMRFRPKNNILNYNFSAYIFKSFSFYKELWRKAQGATRYTLSKDAIEQSKITIPKDLGEQKAIAEVLMTADEEIGVLQKKLKILKDQEKYLLNNLVTGQIRVPENV